MTTATINNTIFRFTTFTNRQTDKQTDKRKKIGLEINVVCAFLQSDRLIEKYDYVDDFIRVAERSVELFDGTMLAALELFEFDFELTALVEAGNANGPTKLT